VLLSFVRILWDASRKALSEAKYPETKHGAAPGIVGKRRGKKKRIKEDKFPFYCLSPLTPPTRKQKSKRAIERKVKIGAALAGSAAVT